MDSLRTTLRTLGALLLTIVCLGLAACAGFRAHDAERSKVADKIKTSYVATDILGTLDIQRENLAALSTEELRIVRENLGIQRDFAMLEVVDNDTPMGLTWEQDVLLSIKDLGLESPATLRKFVQSVEERRILDRELSGLVDRILRATAVEVPPCNESTPAPDEFDWPAELTEQTLNRAKVRYKIYFNSCEQLVDATGDIGSKGALRRVRANWEKARNELKQLQQTARNEAKKVQDARKAHKDAVQAVTEAGNKGKELRKRIKEKADELEHILTQAAKIAPGIVANERITGLVTLLEAAASGSADFDTPEGVDQDLAESVLLVSGVSSLAGDIATLVATAKPPSVSNLLIELQHQVVLLEYARALAALEEERVDILGKKYYAYGDEAAELLKLHDALCSFGVLTAGGKHPRQTCDEFSVSEDGKSCKVAGTEITNCGLQKSWKSYLKSPPSGDEGREFYKALAAFNRLFPIRASQAEDDFRLIDVQHRKNLAAREMALRAWNNLAAVPIDQIEAYYASGVKPAEIADLLVKALGLTAIAIAVSD